MNNFMTLVSTNQKSVAPKNDGSTKDLKSNTKNSTKDFISILFDQIKNSAIIPSKSDIKIRPVSDITEKYSKKDEKPKTSSEILLGDILNIITQLKDDNSITKFPKFSDKMDKILNDESAKNDFKNIKNLDDVFKLSKKYNLALEDIKFTKVDIDTLKKDFPKLNFKDFFDIKQEEIPDTGKKPKQPHKTNKQVIIESLLKNQSTEKSDNLPKNILQTLLKDVDEDTKKVITKNNEEDKKLKVENYLKDEKTGTKNINEKTEQYARQEPSTPKKNSDKFINIQNTSPKKQSSISQKAPTQADISNLSTEYSKQLNKNEKDSNNPKESQTKHIDHKKAIKNSTVISDVKEQKNQIHQNTQETVLQTIKQSKMSVTKEMQNLTANTATDKDSQNENRENRSDSMVHKPEFKTQTDNQKTIKHTEEKQGINQFTNDLKEKMEQYKPPIMRVKMALNPKNLGEVEVTLIHRGNNLHVNITSNTNTMSLFTQNQAEFKNSLVNMGFTNLEMNFSDQNKQN